MKDKIIKLGYSAREVDELLSVSKDIEKDYNQLLKQYPIQYLIGYVNFYGYKINVNENVLIPRYETEFLVEKTIKYYKELFNNKKVSVLDIGTGSGAIGIAISKEIDSLVTCSDISKDALAVAKENAKLNNAKINFVESDVFSNISGKYDIIISNPPYVDYDEEVDVSVKKYEPHLALYAPDNGLYFYNKIIREAKTYLNDKFIIAFEIGYTEGQRVVDIAKELFNDSKIVLEKDLSNKDRYVFIIKD